VPAALDNVQPLTGFLVIGGKLRNLRANYAQASAGLELDSF
jgi:hypothetical protein